MEIDPILQGMEETKQNPKAKKRRGNPDRAIILLRHFFSFLVCVRDTYVLPWFNLQ
jgi:hypothetical protein